MRKLLAFFNRKEKPVIPPETQSVIDELQYRADRERQLARLTMVEVQERLADGALRLVRGN